MSHIPPPNSHPLHQPQQTQQNQSNTLLPSTSLNTSFTSVTQSLKRGRESEQPGNAPPIQQARKVRLLDQDQSNQTTTTTTTTTTTARRALGVPVQDNQTTTTTTTEDVFKVRSNNLYYEGDFKDGLADGQGKFDFMKKYKGGWKCGLEDGIGTSYYFQGAMVENRIEERAFYSGEWKSGKRHGTGSLFFISGCISYKGEWLNDKRDGKGTSYFNNGKISYQGQWRNGEYDGIGTKNYFGGQMQYDGEWKKGKKEGFGAEITYVIGGYTDPTYLTEARDYTIIRYEGYFKDDLRQGCGVEYAQVILQNQKTESLFIEQFTGIWEKGNRVEAINLEEDI